MKILYEPKRYKVQARRKDEQRWTEWTIVDTYEDAVKHSKRAEELGYESRIVDRGEKTDELDKLH